MEQYVDGFVIPIAKDKVEQYKQLAQRSSSIWMRHGALAYYECVGDDLSIEGVRSFLEMAGAGPEDTVIFSWVVYASREHRDKTNAAIMADPEMKEIMETTTMPFNCQQMAYGGFKPIVVAPAKA